MTTLRVERADLPVQHGFGGPDHCAARAASAKRPVRSLPFRLVNVTSPPTTVTIARNPSHFGSYTQSSPRGRVSDDVESIGT